MRTRYLSVFSFLIALIIAHGSHAALTEIKPLNFKGLYHIGWGGITLGYIVFASEEKAGLYKASVEIRTAGLAKVFKKHKSNSTVLGVSRQNGFLPVKFHTGYQRKNKDRREITLNYDRSGDIVYEHMSPPENRAERPAVTPKEKKDSVDPITSVYVMRASLIEALAAKKSSFTIPVYEGRRLMEIKALMGGEDSVEANDKTYEVVKLNLSRTPKAGFTAKELKTYEEGEPGVTAYFSKSDARVFPVKLEVELTLGTLLTQLVKECDDATECTPN